MEKNFLSYIMFILFLLIFLVFNLFTHSQWFLDNIIGLIFLSFVYFFNRWFKLSKLGFFLICLGVLFHNLGTFGFYNWRLGFIAYDNIVHFFSAFAAAYVIFNFLARKMHVKESQRIKNNIIDEHKIIFIFLVMSAVVLLGIVVELIEFGGFMFLGPGEGMLFTGIGDSDNNISDVAGQYVDTMGDILLNILGAIFGVVFYYYLEYNQKPWLNY